MTRYRAPLNTALATVDEAARTLELRFDAPERAVAPGQLVALYATGSSEVLGAATIGEPLPECDEASRT